MSYVIFSRSWLISFSFEIILSEQFKSAPPPKSKGGRVCPSISALMKAIGKKTKLLLLDITELDHADTRFLLNTVKSKHSINIILFCDEYTDMCHFPHLYNAALCWSSSLVNIRETINSVRVNGNSGDIINIDGGELRKSVLTRREQEVLGHIRSGLNNSQISDILSLNYKTVSAHRRSICVKYGVNNLDVYYSKQKKKISLVSRTVT
ncbi:response regulator transcription factor [Yersinia sp. 2545 StPb PI]|uniref:response regulator transcription factor n=1 Tax=unclassified Yersinia (in: enterobacteria) TaxID=2653513 RepID=UPI003FA48E49